MREARVVGSVANLPTTTFGHRSLVWWGTLSFIVIEGSTLFVCLVSYLYVRQNFSTWPPEHVMRPALDGRRPAGRAHARQQHPDGDGGPRRAAARPADRAHGHGRRVAHGARHVRPAGVRAARAARALGQHCLRLRGLGYLVTHSTLLLLETVETLVFTVLLFSRALEQRDISGVSDNALYWYFMTGVWIPLAALVFLSPYVL